MLQLSEIFEPENNSLKEALKVYSTPGLTSIEESAYHTYIQIPDKKSSQLHFGFNGKKAHNTFLYHKNVI